MKDRYFMLVGIVSAISVLLGIVSFSIAQTPQEDKAYERCDIDTTVLDSQELLE